MMLARLAPTPDAGRAGVVAHGPRRCPMPENSQHILDRVRSPRV
ncbi:hypothetical protein FRUB_01561 [Fimbriiglobus ruber]|uniref:Uncharacterized protein n=1 Tax=Fimbriiglobus ruber TaxID=1908690 RepID=A0A225DUN8_9BACT|nr:hypothetical protein FRUB_01561 [Fimbriiglobus ruber]